jgi:uncharacterized protein YecE (DUF72 family)
MYKDWEGIVYPPARRGFDRLGFMATLFDTNEINSTFYRIPPASMARDWARRVAHNPLFLFTAKLYRGFTHERNATAADEKAVCDAMDALASAGRLGAVLVQVPMSFRATEENRALLERVFARFAAFPLAAEFRHFSWDTTGTLRFLEDRSVGFVNIDQPRLKGNLPPTSHVTGPIAYFRFHGRNAAKWFGPDTSNEERYNYLYDERELAPWAERIKDSRGDRSHGPAPATVHRGDRSHGPAPATVHPMPHPDSITFAIMNNHFRGQAVANALQLQQMLTGDVRAAPDSLRETYSGIVAYTTQARSGSQKRLF